MKKLALFVIPIVAVAAVAGGVFASGSTGICGYNENGTFVSSDGTVSAFGTMSDAAACAAEGKLPDAVAARLGILGGTETRQWAAQIKQLDAEVKQKLAEENTHG